MTRRCIEGSLLVALAAVLGLALPAVAEEDVLYGEAGYRADFDSSVPASQVNFQPIALTAGSDYLGEVNIEDVLVRCGIHTGKKGVRVLFDGSLAEGDDLQPVGNFPLESKKTKGNGYAVFEKRASDVFPPPDLSSVEDPLLIILDTALDGTKAVEVASINCTLGVPPPPCAANITLACLGGNRFKTKMYWKDPLNGERREATVKESDKKSARFVFPPIDPVVGRVVTLIDDCTSQNVLAFGIEASGHSSIESLVEVLDTKTGVVRQFSGGEILDTNAFLTCP